MPAGIGPAAAVPRRVVEDFGHHCADLVVADSWHDQATVISAHKNPASSRAIAAATTLLMFLRAAS